MKRINFILIITMITLFMGCSSNNIKYNDLEACQTELVIDKSSGMLKHRIYKIDIPAKTSVRIRGALIKTTGRSTFGIHEIFNEKEIGLFGGSLTSQVISITGNDNVEKKVIRLNGDNSYKVTENGIPGLKSLIDEYDRKDIQILKTGKINEEETYKDVKIINYPYLNSSFVASFWLTNNTETTQTVYYNIFLKDTKEDGLINIGRYFLEKLFGNSNSSHDVEKKNINYVELYKLVTTALNEDDVEGKIKKMERYCAEKYIREKVKNTLEDYFGELSNGQDKLVNYFTTVYTDIYIESNPYFYKNKTSVVTQR